MGARDRAAADGQGVVGLGGPRGQAVTVYAAYGLGRRPPQPPTRRELITAIITSQPPRACHELALRLHVKPRNMLTQLGEWARLGFFTRTGSGTYALNTPPADTSSTTAPDP
jgi:hypothetical protein